MIDNHIRIEIIFKALDYLLILLVMTKLVVSISLLSRKIYLEIDLIAREALCSR